MLLEIDDVKQTRAPKVEVGKSKIPDALPCRGNERIDANNEQRFDTMTPLTMIDH